VKTALKDPDTANALSQTKAGRHILGYIEENRNENQASKTPQDISEEAITAFLDKHFTLWRSRPQLSYHLYLAFYQIRNRVFGITAQTTRKMIPLNYTINFDSLTALLDRARAKDIQVLVYIAPTRMDVEIPWSKEEYEKFKKELADLARAKGAKFENMEGIIPGEYWGKKEMGQGLELDFAHFQARGHEVLADKLMELFRKHFPEEQP
jgi:hypothetical protein